MPMKHMVGDTEKALRWLGQSSEDSSSEAITAVIREQKSNEAAAGTNENT